MGGSLINGAYSGEQLRQLTPLEMMQEAAFTELINKKSLEEL